MDGCSFLHSRRSDAAPSSASAMLDASHIPRERQQQQHRRRRLKSTTTVLGYVIDDGLLLTILSISLVVLIAAICWVELWLLRHSDDVDQVFPGAFYFWRHPRVRHVSSSLHLRSHTPLSRGNSGETVFLQTFSSGKVFSAWSLLHCAAAVLNFWVHIGSQSTCGKSYYTV